MPKIAAGTRHRALAFAALLAATTILAPGPRLASAATDGQWNLNGDGVWNDPAHWLGNSIPSLPGDTALFGTVLTDPLGAVVFLNGNQTLAGLTFNSTAGGYTLAQGTDGTFLALQGSTNGQSTLAINIAAGQHTLNVPFVANADLVINATSNGTTPVSLNIQQPVQVNGTTTFNASGASVVDLHLNGSSANVTSTCSIIGNTAGTTRVTIDGGSLVSTGNLNGSGASLLVGSANGSASYLRLNSGTLTTAGEFWLGERSTNSEFVAFSQSGGTVTAGDFFTVGNTSDRAVFNMTGGAFTVSRDAMTIGAGYTLGNAIGVANLSGGTFTAVGPQQIWSPGIYVGEIGTGVLTISNTACVTATNVQCGNNLHLASVSGIINILGGTLTAETISLSPGGISGVGILNFNGGLVKSRNGLVIYGLTSAYIYPGGAFIDDAGTPTTILQPLLAPTGNGVAAIAVSGGSGYLDTPILQLSRGAGDTTGTGATAVATVDANGHLLDITITNPGVDYTKTPVVTLIGGGGSGASVGSVTLAPNTSGGLTKLGSGTVKLTRANTYSGPTQINAGTLQFGSGSVSGSPGTGSIINNAILAFNRSDSLAVSNTISGTGTLTQIGSGTTTLIAVNSYSGPTVITAGTLQIGNGTTNGSLGTSVLTNNSAFAIKPKNALTLPNNIDGAGSLSHLGTGTTTLTGQYSATGPILLSAGALIFANSTAQRQTPAVLLAPSSLGLFPSTTLDVTNHDLMLGNSNLTTIESQILKGFNKAGNASDPAITSSTALSNGTTFLVPIDADALLGNGTPGSAIGKIFDGTAISQPHTILLKYAYLGDITLDGKIDALDMATAAGHFNQSTPGLADIQTSWLMGDINFDGIVDAQDFAIMNANSTLSTLAPLGLLDLSQSQVPEPTTCLTLLAGSLLLLRRRPRH